MKKTHAKGHVHKHVRTHHKHAGHHVKHHPAHHHKTATAHGHHVHAKAKHPAQAKARALALAPDDVGCCTTEALAASLRVQGLSIADAAVLDLFRAAGGDEDKGMPVRVALEAASEFGLAGFRLASWEPWPGRYLAPISRRPGLRADALALSYPKGANLQGGTPTRDLPQSTGRHPDLQDSALILGVDLPGPHTVLATLEGWWSWGGLWCPWCSFPDVVIEEAWSVSWQAAA